MRKFSLTFPTPPHPTPPRRKKRLSHYLSSKGLLPLLPLVPWGLAYNPNFKYPSACRQIESMEFLVPVHNRPPPPAAPITDYGFAELLTIIIVCALNYALLCVFSKSLKFVRRSRERSALPACVGDLW